jgi:hypothetical protein
MGQGLDNNELRLCRINQFGNWLQMAIVVTKYDLNSYYTMKTLHLVGEEVFRSQKNVQIKSSPRIKRGFSPS